ncbi:hypothetical protein EVAR_12993_1 [Eumeta japonica]|uniref:Uncharacterized protein n=1 Tax=Eumeta variegata TaxID=151549 RepID=A0A4C1TWY0_EUMVA|nr:hypothetical protein EVAR_12993_1 [Eumeta japonica]
MALFRLPRTFTPMFCRGGRVRGLMVNYWRGCFSECEGKILGHTLKLLIGDAIKSWGCDLSRSDRPEPRTPPAPRAYPPLSAAFR